VYVRKRVRRRRSFYKKHQSLLLILLGLGACVFSFYFMRAIQNGNGSVSLKNPVQVREPELAHNVQSAGSKRIVYPYSVIRGGVRSREELAASIRNDSIVAAHYADFKVDQSRIVEAEETKFVYVSYRKRDKIYWTAKQIRLPKGETLITDGINCSRTRCGNRVSATPEEPVSEEEPSIGTFDIPYLVSLKPPDTEITPESILHFVAIPQNDVVVPEPGTLGLLSAGLAIIAVRFRRKR
jgi:hypothetical protein